MPKVCRWHRDDEMTAKELVFSGVQPTGNLHLGNYLGAIVNFVKLQETHNCIYCVVDMHAITVWQNPAELTHTIREVTAAFIASGVDPKKNIVFNQSQVAEHADVLTAITCSDVQHYMAAQNEALALLEWLKKFAFAFLKKEETPV